jgi:hypothetical protein
MLIMWPATDRAVVVSIARHDQGTNRPVAPSAQLHEHGAFGWSCLDGELEAG